VEWEEIDRMPCAVRLLPIPPPSAPFHDFDDFEKLVEAAGTRRRRLPRRFQDLAGHGVTLDALAEKRQADALEARITPLA
jgi:hypothetical protein